MVYVKCFDYLFVIGAATHHCHVVGPSLLVPLQCNWTISTLRSYIFDDIRIIVNWWLMAGESGDIYIEAAAAPVCECVYAQRPRLTEYLNCVLSGNGFYKRHSMENHFLKKKKKLVCHWSQCTLAMAVMHCDHTSAAHMPTKFIQMNV